MMEFLSNDSCMIPLKSIKKLSIRPCIPPDVAVRTAIGKRSIIHLESLGTPIGMKV